MYTSTATADAFFGPYETDLKFRSIDSLEAGDSADTQPLIEVDDNEFQRAERYDLSEPGDFDTLNLRARIYSISLPERWSEEGVVEPTISCRSLAARLAISFYNAHHIIPERVSANVEEGITLVYFNHIAKKALVLEVYNTTEIAAIINQGKKILAAEDIRSSDDVSLFRLAKDFKKTDNPASS